MGFLAPVVTVIGGFLGSALGQVAVGLGLNMIGQKIQRDQAKKAQKAAAGTQFDREYGEDVSRKVACGRVAVSGHDCFVNTYGKSNKYLEQVYVFSDYPCDGLAKIYIGGKELSLRTEDGKNYSIVSGDYAGRITFVFYDGTQTTADAGLIANSNPTGRWTAQHLGAGLCYLIARLTYSQEKLSQFPEFFFELRGARLYDPRKDSSIGGSGNHRWGNYATHEFTENPVIMDYNYRRGFSWNGDLFLGMDMPASDLPFDRYVAAANICDEAASYGTRYRCSILLDADLDHGDNIDSLMTSCGGVVIDSVDGSWPLIGTEQPIVAIFTDADLVAGEPVKFRRYRSMSELTNMVSGTYPEPSNMWSPAGYDAQTHAGTVAADRRTRDVPLNFEQVPYKGQANQLASIYFNENRYEKTADVVLRPAFRNVKAGDWVFWDSANVIRRGIYMVKASAIRALDSDGPRNVVLSLQERDGAIYESVGVNPPPSPVPNGEPVYLNQLQDWAVIPVISTGADGRAYPAFRMSWALIDDVTVRSIAFQWWLKSAPDNKFSRTIEADTTIGFIQEGILGLSDYEFTHKLIADRVTNWVDPITVQSLDAGMDDVTVGLGQVRDDIRDRFSELQAAQDEFWRQLDDIATSFSLEGAVGQIDRQKLRVEVGKAFAEISQERRLRITDQEALAQQIVTISAGIAEAIARVATEETARATADTAMASSITGITADVNGRFAQGLVEFRAASAPTGVDARFSVMLKAGTASAFRESGLFIEIYTQNGVQRSRMAVQADQFVVDNGGGTSVYPLVFENGELKLQVGNVGLLRAGRIEGGPQGKLIIDITTGIMEFYD